MTIYASLKDYIRRHRRGLLITATIAGGSYLAGRYATRKIADMQEKAASERLAKENLKRRFEQNQNDCVFTVLSLLPTLSEEVLNEMNIEVMWAKLQESRKLEKKEESTRMVQTMGSEPREEQPGQDQPSQEGSESVEETRSPTTDGLEVSVGSLSTSILSEEAATSPTTHLAGLLNKKQKHLLWEDIKASSFTRTLTAMYTLTLLTLLTHLQLNLLGRFTYVWSVSILNRSEPTIRLQHEDDVETGFVDPQTERMYLSVSWWLLHRGWRKCMARVKEAVDLHVADLSLKNAFTLDEAHAMIDKLRRHIEHEDKADSDSIAGHFRSWVLPDTPEEEAEFLKETGFEPEYSAPNDTVTLRRLLDETKDFVDSPDFASVLSSCLDEVFGVFDQRTFSLSLLKDGKAGAKKMTLANMLPSISRQAHVALAGNEYIDAFAYIKELQAFSAIVYTQYGDEAMKT